MNNYSHVIYNNVVYIVVYIFQGLKIKMIRNSKRFEGALKKYLGNQWGFVRWKKNWILYGVWEVGIKKWLASLGFREWKNSYRIFQGTPWSRKEFHWGFWRIYQVKCVIVIRATKEINKWIKITGTLGVSEGLGKKFYKRLKRISRDKNNRGR